MTDDTREPLPNDYRAVQGLDPSPVDTEAPDVNQGRESCQVVEATTRDGQPITFAVHTVAPLTETEQAMFGQIAQAAAERMRRDDPYGGVITELMQASLRSQLALRSAGASQLADRLSAAVRAGADVIRAGRVERMSRFRWAEEAAELKAHVQQLHTDLAAAVIDARATNDLLARLVRLLGGVTLTDEQRAELEAIATAQTPQLCPVDGEPFSHAAWDGVGPVVITHQDGSSHTEPAEPPSVSVIVDRATGERHEYPQQPGARARELRGGTHD